MDAEEHAGFEPQAADEPRAPTELVEGDPRRSPDTPWRPWTAPLALIGGVAVAVIGQLVLTVIALLFGAHVTTSHTPGGLVIAGTFVQEVGFVLAALYFAKLAPHPVRSWQFGLRRPGNGWGWAVFMVACLIVAFLGLDGIWAEILHPTKEKLLETLGTKESRSLLVLSAALTCVAAPIGEEMLFRGYMFTALRNWKGTLPAALIVGVLFGGVHVGSAPAADLVPLGALGFGLCLIYRFTGSLYPGIASHALNNSIAFTSLEGWNAAQGLALTVCALAGLAVIAQGAKRAGWVVDRRGIAGSTT